jgi:hypothetical protein
MCKLVMHDAGQSQIDEPFARNVIGRARIGEKVGPNPMGHFGPIPTPSSRANPRPIGFVHRFFSLIFDGMFCPRGVIAICTASI